MNSESHSGRSLLRLATPLFAGRGFSSIITFLIPLVMARYLAKEEFGTYKQFFLIASTCFLIGQLGITASLYYFVPRAAGKGGRYVLQALGLLFTIGLAAGTVVLLGGHELARRFDNPHLAALIVPLALYVWAIVGAAPLEIMLTSSSRTGWAGLTYVLSDSVRTAALVVPIVLHAGLEALAWGAAAYAGLRLVTAWTLALAGAPGERLAPTRATLREQLHYAVPFGGAVALSVAQMQLPPYLVAALTDAATYAVFAVGALQVPFTDMLYSPVAEVMMVRLARSPREIAPAVFREAVSRLVLFFLPLAAFLWAVGPEVIHTLYTSRYGAAVPIFMVAIFELLLQILPVDGLLRSLGDTRAILRNNVLRLLFSLVAVPAGLKLLGLPGVMLGYVATQTLAKVLLLRAGARKLGVSPLSLLPGRAILAWAGRSAVLFVAVAALRWSGALHGVKLLAVAAAVAAVTWFASLVLAGELGRRKAPAPSPAPATPSGLDGHDPGSSNTTEPAMSSTI